jgi:uncharacterized membrane protein YbhN (UPF0104 family)
MRCLAGAAETGLLVIGSLIAFVLGMAVYALRLPFYVRAQRRAGRPFSWASAFGFSLSCNTSATTEES